MPQSMSGLTLLCLLGTAPLQVARFTFAGFAFAGEEVGPDMTSRAVAGVGIRTTAPPRRTGTWSARAAAPMTGPKRGDGGAMAPTLPTTKLSTMPRVIPARACSG